MRLDLMAGVVALAAAASVWLLDGGGRAGAAPAVTEAEVADQTIAVFEARFRDDPYRYLDGSRLSNLYMLRFQRGADPDDLARAEQVARLILGTAQDRATAEARLALILIARHAFEKAIGHAWAAVEADPDGSPGLAALFDAAVALGRYDEAGEALGTMKPGTFSRQWREARWLAAHGELREAARLLRRGCDRLERSPGPRQIAAWCLTGLANIEHERSGPEAARLWLDRALDVDPGNRGAIELLADLAYARADWVRAERLYRRVESDVHPDIYLRLAEVHSNLGRKRLAAASRRRFVEVASDSAAEPLYAHGLAIHLVSLPAAAARDRALEVAGREIARRPSAESYEVLAWVRLARDEPGLALEALDRAPAWGAPSQAAQYLRAAVLAALGRDAEANPLFEAAEADPSLLPHHLQDDLRRKPRP